MRIALIGLAGSGKTTVFNAVAGHPVEAQPGLVQTETHVQVIRVRDPRLEALRDLFAPRKYTPAGLELHDPPGVPTASGAGDEDRKRRLLSQLRDADAYVLVVRGFSTDAYAYDRPAPDPAAEVRRLGEELIAADFVVAGGRAEKLRQSVQKRSRTMEQDRLELAVLEKVIAGLEQGDDLTALTLAPADEKRLRGFQLFARKPYVLLLNGPDAPSAALGADLPLAIRARMGMDAQIEAELAAMDPADRPAFMEEFGIEASAAERFVREVYRGVGLRSFFTVGEDEVRAWTVHAGDDAVTAAGKIHTDLARGFVRAEVCRYDALLAAGGLKELKAQGGVRLEPKDYEVLDGDVVHIRSAV